MPEAKQGSCHARPQTGAKLTRAIQKHFSNPINRFCFHPSNTIDPRQDVSRCRRHNPLCTTQTGSNSYPAGIHLIRGQQTAAFWHILFGSLFSGLASNGITTGAEINQKQVGAPGQFTIVDLQRRWRDRMTGFSFWFLAIRPPFEFTAQLSFNGDEVYPWQQKSHPCLTLKLLDKAATVIDCPPCTAEQQGSRGQSVRRRQELTTWLIVQSFTM